MTKKCHKCGEIYDAGDAALHLAYWSIPSTPGFLFLLLGFLLFSSLTRLLSLWLMVFAAGNLFRYSPFEMP